MSEDIKLNVVFPVGKKPEINFHESIYADKDCYIYWDMEHLKLNPSWVKDAPPEQKEVYAINSMLSRLESQQKRIAALREALEFYAAKDTWAWRLFTSYHDDGAEDDFENADICQDDVFLDNEESQFYGYAGKAAREALAEDNKLGDNKL